MNGEPVYRLRPENGPRTGICRATFRLLFRSCFLIRSEDHFQIDSWSIVGRFFGGKIYQKSDQPPCPSLMTSKSNFERRHQWNPCFPWSHRVRKFIKNVFRRALKIDVDSKSLLKRLGTDCFIDFWSILGWFFGICKSSFRLLFRPCVRIRSEDDF